MVSNYLWKYGCPEYMVALCLRTGASVHQRLEHLCTQFPLDTTCMPQADKLPFMRALMCLKF